MPIKTATLVIALLAASTTSALADDIDVALYVEHLPAGACAGDAGYSKLFGSAMNADGTMISAGKAAEAVCKATLGTKTCDVHRFTVFSRRELNTDMVVVKGVTPCIMGGSEVTYGFGVGLGAEAAEKEAVQNLGQRNWSWSNKKHGYSKVETISLGPPPPSPPLLAVRCLAPDPKTGKPVSVTKDVFYAPTFSGSGRLEQIQITEGETTTTLSRHNLRQAQEKHDKGGKDKTDADLLIFRKRDGTEEFRVTRKVLGRALCGGTPPDSNAIFGKAVKHTNDTLQFLLELRCRFAVDSAACQKGTKMRTATMGTRG